MATTIFRVEAASPCALRPPDPAGNDRHAPVDSPTHATAQLDALHAGYAASGGMISGDAWCAAQRMEVGQPISLLARWFVTRRVVHCEMRGGIWLPRFQFHGGSARVHAVVLRALDELNHILHDGGVAHWFAEPNAALDGRVPADAFAQDPLGVLDAAITRRDAAAHACPRHRAFGRDESRPFRRSPAGGRP